MNIRRTAVKLLSALGDAINPATEETQEDVVFNTGKGVPVTFTKQTSSSKTFLIQKGQLNHYRQRPAITNEHVETARQVQTVVTSTNMGGQIFRASQDNINGIDLTLESAAGEVFDNFETYADSTALQVKWIETDVADKAELSAAVFAPGGSTKSMSIPGNATVGDEWYQAFATTDFTDFIGEFDFFATHQYGQSKLRVYVQDALGNTSSAPIVQQDTLSWEHIEIDVNNLSPDIVTPADITDIVRIGFRLEDARNGSSFNIDNMISVPPPGSVQLELWNMGAALPVSAVTSLDDGAQYLELGDKGLNGGTVAASVQLPLIGGKRLYHVRKFSAGPALEIPGNTPLTPGNYYAIVIRYVDTDVSVYGSDTSYSINYYVNGYAFTAPNDSTPITQIGEYSDLQFAVFSTQDVWVNTLLKFYDAEPGNDARESVYIEDCNMKIVNVVTGENRPQQSLLAEFKDRYLYFPKGGKFEVNHSDDPTDDTTQITALIGYMYEPLTVYG